MALRHTVVERVVDSYTFHRRAGNKFVLTSRIVGYRGAAHRARPGRVHPGGLRRRRGDGVRHPLDRRAGEPGPGRGSAAAQADALRERRELLAAIQRNPGVRRLAANPLLLTILALMKRQGVTLPDRRVELYDQYVKTLLSTWSRARGSGRAPSRELDPVQTLRVLAPLALWMHEVNPGVGLVKGEALRRKMESIYGGRGEESRKSRPAVSGGRARARRPAAGAGRGRVRLHPPDLRGVPGGGGDRVAGPGGLPTNGEPVGGARGGPSVARGDAAGGGLPGHHPAARPGGGRRGGGAGGRQPGAPGEAVVLAGEAVLDALPGGVPPGSKAR